MVREPMLAEQQNRAVVNVVQPGLLAVHQPSLELPPIIVVFPLPKLVQPPSQVLFLTQQKSLVAQKYIKSGKT